MDFTERIKQKINTLPYDLKAEVVVASIVEEMEQTGEFNFYVNPISQFKRSYRKDIVNSEVVDFEYDARQFVKIDLSRDGIYDTLPEGILHDRQYSHKDVSADEMAKHYQERKKEEESARLFFLPFENEFFEHALDRERREKRYLLNLNGEKPMDFLYDFWGIKLNIPENLAAKFIRLIPYMYEIVGNIPLTEICLMYLLNEEVNILQMDYSEYVSENQDVALGANRLGIDFVSGATYLDHTINMKVVIGPIVNSDFKSYINNGELHQFLKLFYEYIFPLEVAVTTSIELPVDKEEFKVEELNQPVLGITTRI